MATDWAKFKAQRDDDASEAFRIASEGDRPVRQLCPLPDVHDCYRRAGAVARGTVVKATVELGIKTPELRWFKEMRSAYDDDPRPMVCGGLVLPSSFPGVVWLNVRAAMEPLAGLERTVWHECAHLAGYLSEDEADRIADGHVAGGETLCRDSSDEIQWIPSRAAVQANYWELRSA
jgi:hypothetical protein